MATETGETRPRRKGERAQALCPCGSLRGQTNEGYRLAVSTVRLGSHVGSWKEPRGEGDKMPKYKVVKVHITTEDGELLDSFAVTHWRDNSVTTYEELEAVGSTLSNASLAQRIEQYVEQS